MTSIYIYSVYMLLVIIRTARFLMFVTLLLYFHWSMLAHRKLNGFELNPNREFLKQGPKQMSLC